MRSVLLFSFLTFCFVGYGQIIDFPDANFKNALVNTKCVDSNGDGLGDADADLNNDGEIDVSEALNVIVLIVSTKQISSLSGIEYFTNLNNLNCDYNKLMALNIQNLTNLVSLSFSFNQIESIDLHGLTNLKVLDCSQNQFTTLDLQGLTNFTNLNCAGNKLTSLNVRGLINLNYLICSGNQLKSLEINDLKSLSNLNCSYNQLSSLDIQELTNLTDLNCRRNELKVINIQTLENLKELNCDENQLTTLDIQGLKKLIFLSCNRNQMKWLNVENVTNLIQLYCNDNKLTALNVQPLTKLTHLDCGYNYIKTLNVKGLTNLTHLFCNYCGLNTLDIKELTNLIRLECTQNLLTQLDVQKLINLKVLNCSYNSLNFLNVKELTNLTNLSCSKCKLTSLDLFGLTKLSYLDFSFNDITTIDVQGLTNLSGLQCTNNLLTSLDAQGLTNLQSLSCNGNQLTYLDVQGLTNLISLYCHKNQLTFLNVKGTKLNQNFSFDDNPNLSYICCDEEKITKINNLVIANDQNCEVNSYCSFTPGGKFYVIKGKNTYDENINGCDDQDIKMANLKYNITDGNILGTIISNSTGNYQIPIQAGTHTITPVLEYPENFEVTPPFITIILPNTSDTITQDFCITPKGIFRQTNITLIPLTPPARPGFDASYKIVWENAGNQIESGTLNFTYEETLLDYISATQTEDLKSDGIVSWYFNNLLPFEKREITVTLKVNRPTDTPAVNAGDKLYLAASILDNIFTLENTVVGSYDPNDKTCLQGNRVKPDMVGEYVDYLIRFENTGNYAAENVVVKDIIDTKTFDISTLKITDASHEVYTRIEDNKVEFIFENIQLPFDDANNDGYIAFKIKTLPTLVLGDSLKNLADIYFDYNFPIRTNEAQTTVAFPIFTKDITTEVNIYPNPVTDILYLDTNDHWTKAEIYDISGRIMRSISLDTSYMDVSGLESGTYFFRLKDGEKVGLVKFVKM